jgi:hypothetical protein
MRPPIECLNDIRSYNREHGITKSKWKAPKLAPFDPAAPIEPISWAHAKALAHGYHQARQPEREGRAECYRGSDAADSRVVQTRHRPAGWSGLPSISPPRPEG